MLSMLRLMAASCCSAAIVPPSSMTKAVQRARLPSRIPAAACTWQLLLAGGVQPAPPGALPLSGLTETQRGLRKEDRLPKSVPVAVSAL